MTYKILHYGFMSCKPFKIILSTRKGIKKKANDTGLKNVLFFFYLKKKETLNTNDTLN